MNKYRILGLDISSACTGFAVVNQGRWRNNSKSHGTIELSGKISLTQKLSHFRYEVEKLCLSIKPDKVIIEDIFANPSISTTKTLARFSGVGIECVYSTLKIEPILVYPSTVRAYFKCGRSKEDSFLYVCKKYNLTWSFKEMNDVADALLLALYGHKNDK